MQLVFLYGPPAVGKTTIAHALAQLTGYRVFPNHQFVGLLATLFPYDDESVAIARTKVSRDTRLRIYTGAAEAGVSFITTFGMAGPAYFEFFRDVARAVRGAGGNVCFVQLIAQKHELLRRVGEPSRKGQKIDSGEHLNKLFETHPDIFMKYPDVQHLTIDTTSAAPSDVARTIAAELDGLATAANDQVGSEAPLETL